MTRKPLKDSFKKPATSPKYRLKAAAMRPKRAVKRTSRLG